MADNSFLAFQLLAPRAEIQLGDNVTFRGKAWGKEIKVGGDAILSSDSASSLEPEPEDIVSTAEGAMFVVNQVILQLVPGAALADANLIAGSINGRIVGVVPSINLYQVQTSTRTADELDNLIQQLLSQQNPKIKIITRNNLISLIQ